MGLCQVSAIVILVVVITLWSSDSGAAHAASSSMMAAMGSPKNGSNKYYDCGGPSGITVINNCCSSGNGGQNCCPVVAGENVVNCNALSGLGLDVLGNTLLNGLLCSMAGQCSSGDTCINLIDLSTQSTAPTCCSNVNPNSGGSDDNDSVNMLYCGNNITCNMDTGYTTDAKQICCAGSCNNVESTDYS